MQFSPDQKLLCIFTLKNMFGIIDAGVLIYNVSSTSITLFRTLVPQQITTNGGGQQISSIAWKSRDKLVMLYGLKDKYCEYIISGNIVTCIKLPFSSKSMTYFSYDDQIIFFIINATNSTYTSYTIMFTDAKTLNYKQHISNETQFQILNVRFKQFNDTLFVCMKGSKSAEILLIKQTCPTGFYYDYCKSSCTIFHQFCTTLDTPGCSCKTSFQNTIQIQFQQEKNIILIILKNQIYTKINEITGMRGMIRFISSYYLQLADFFLYSYHDRGYNFIISNAIVPIKQLQQRKWKLFLNQ